uniref:Uncharacterized protein n=1 Tax=Maylandia zebra TaxID=106582 RepID=A0A3P9DAM1_9CICH
MYSFMGGGLFCAGMENILLIVSTATDYWMQYRQSNNYMHQSLWCYCTPGKCFPFRIKDRAYYFFNLCVKNCKFGISISFIHYSSFDRFDKTFAAGILFFITCFLVFLGMSMLTGVTINYYGKLSRRGGSARRRFYLSLSLSLSLASSLLPGWNSLWVHALSPLKGNTPDAHQGNQHLSQEESAGLRWIVVYHASVRVKLQLKLSQVSIVNVVTHSHFLAYRPPG